jgi:hypothetical protein
MNERHKRIGGPGHYENRIRIAQFRNPRPAPDLHDQNRSGAPRQALVAKG